MALTTQEQILVEQRITNNAKSPAVAYLLWFFLGGLGLHRFYLGATGSAIAILALSVLGLVTLPVGIGFALLVVVGLWLLADLFLIPGLVARHKDTLRQSLTTRALATGQPGA